jgi:predicted secreted protein
MPKISGRKVLLYKGTGGSAALVAGGRETGVSINNEPIDITDKSDDGWRTLLADPSVRSVDISMEGLFDAATYLSLGVGVVSGLTDDFEVRFDLVGTFAGKFMLSTVGAGTPHNDAVTQSLTLVSSGVITWTAYTPPAP